MFNTVHHDGYNNYGATSEHHNDSIMSKDGLPYSSAITTANPLASTNYAHE